MDPTKEKSERQTGSKRWFGDTFVLKLSVEAAMLLQQQHPEQVDALHLVHVPTCVPPVRVCVRVRACVCACARVRVEGVRGGWCVRTLPGRITGASLSLLPLKDACTHTHTHMPECGWGGGYASFPHPPTHTRTHAHTHARTCTHAHTHTRTHTRTHARTHTRTTIPTHTAAGVPLATNRRAV
jgi:hypothetical protein